MGMTQEQLNKITSEKTVYELLANSAKTGVTVAMVMAWSEAHKPARSGAGFGVKVSDKTGILVFSGFSANPKNTVNVYEEPFYRWLAEINNPESDLAKKLAKIRAEKLASQGKSDPRFVKAA